MPSSPHDANRWPSLPPLDAWADTLTTLHMWTQIVGKIRLEQAPWINHSWGVALYVTTRGLTTSPIPCDAGTFAIDFDFVHHSLRITTSRGTERTVALQPMSVAEFYRRTMQELADLEINVSIVPRPVEVDPAIPFDENERDAAYDPAVVHRFWRALVQADRVFSTFRARFLGKCSPVHFFWGAFDLAVTRFSGCPAPPHPGGVPNVADWVMEDAYSHELSSTGFWPGPGLGEAAFYAYAYPEPEGFQSAPVRPEAAYFSGELGEFILPYDAVRTANRPDEALLAFLQSTYEAAADRADWDRAALEYDPPR